MQLTKVAFVAILAAVAQSQSISDLVAKIPTCATPCLTKAITAAGCGLTDYVCQCTTGHDAILASGAPCIAGACQNSDILTTNQLTTQICTLATAGGSGSSAVSSASSVVNSATSAASSAASSVSSVVSSASSAASSASNAASNATISAASSTKPTASSTTIGGASSASTSPTPTASKSAGHGIKVGAGLLGAIVVAAMAL